MQEFIGFCTSICLYVVFEYYWDWRIWNKDNINFFNEINSTALQRFGMSALYEKIFQLFDAALDEQEVYWKQFFWLPFELFSLDHESNELLVAFAELISPFCMNVFLKCPLFKVFITLMTLVTIGFLLAYVLHFVCIVKMWSSVYQTVFWKAVAICSFGRKWTSR